MLIRFYKRYVRPLLKIRYVILAKLLPARLWYRAALRVSRAEALLAAFFRPGDPGWSYAWMVHYWVDELRAFGPFPLPTQTLGMELVKEARANKRGILLVSAHRPLFELILTPLAEVGYTPDLVVSAPYSISDGKYRIAGSGDGVEQVETGANSLLKMRRILRGGGIVACMLDETVNAPLSGNTLRLAAKLSSNIFFWKVKLASNGAIEIAIEPVPPCDTEEAVQAQLQAAEAYRAPYRPSLRGNQPGSAEPIPQSLGRQV